MAGSLGPHCITITELQLYIYYIKGSAALKKRGLKKKALALIISKIFPALDGIVLFFSNLA